MVAYSFQQQFVEPILAGTKRQTIRAVSKRRHAQPGDELQLYTGMRTKHCKLIARATCETITPVMLDFRGHGVIKIGDFVLFSAKRMEQFAWCDGFASFAEMRAFWAKHHPSVEEFNGVLIGWGNIRT